MASVCTPYVDRLHPAIDSSNSCLFKEEFSWYRAMACSDHTGMEEGSNNLHFALQDELGVHDTWSTLTHTR